jgi:hypothetical protein
MRYACIVSLLVVSLASPGFAGKIYGGLSEAGKPVAQGVKIEVTCGSNNYSAETDAYGSFSLFSKEQGKCMLKVHYQNQTPAIDINSYAGSVQYDLILEKKGSEYTLKRK